MEPTNRNSLTVAILDAAIAATPLPSEDIDESPIWSHVNYNLYETRKPDGRSIFYVRREGQNGRIILSGCSSLRQAQEEVRKSRKADLKRQKEEQVTQKAQQHEEILHDLLASRLNPVISDEDFIDHEFSQDASALEVCNANFEKIQKELNSPESYLFKKISATVDKLNQLILADISPAHVEQRREEMIMKLNKFFAFILHSKAECIAMKYLRDEKQGYGYTYISRTQFTNLLEPYVLFTYRQKAVDEGLVWQIEHAAAKKGHIPGIRTLEKDKPPPELHLESVHISYLWLESKKRKVYDNVVFNPRPKGFPHAATPRSLNVWQGFAPGFTRDEVLGFTDFQRYLPLIMNHLRFSWCDSDEEFEYVIASMAGLLQRPWFKQVGFYLAKL